VAAGDWRVSIPSTPTVSTVSVPHELLGYRLGLAVGRTFGLHDMHVDDHAIIRRSEVG